MITLPAPAKLNLFLHILGRREDGYHELQTVFQLLDHGDELTFTMRDDGIINVTPDIPGVTMQSNLVYRAADMIKANSEVEDKDSLGADIHLQKILPIGGGIGGGSSDAATTLLGLNMLWQLDMNIASLAELGRQLGADVPVFVKGRSAWAEGIGEQLEPIDLPDKFFLVLAPDCHVSTAEVFSHKDLTRDTLAIRVAAFLERGGKNDCQPLVETLFPQVRDAVEWLGQFGPTQLTGTGACVFASFPSREAADAVFALKPNRFDGFVARGVNHSPLHQRLIKKGITGV